MSGASNFDAVDRYTQQKSVVVRFISQNGGMGDRRDKDKNLISIFEKWLEKKEKFMFMI